MQSSHADANGGEPGAVSGLAAGVGVSLAAIPNAAADNNNDDSGSRVVNGGGPAVDPVSVDIFVLKHESSIFRSFIQPCMRFWKCRASSPEAKQYRA